jgi:hypothetical protein
MLTHLSHLTNQLHLAFVTDGDPSQCLGICYLLNAFASRLERQTFPYPVSIVGSQRHESEIRRWFELGCNNLKIKFMAMETCQDDRYYIQLGLRRVIGLLRSHEYLLALDYDHLVLDPIRFPFALPRQGVSVSSETSDNSELDLTDQTTSSGKIEMPKKHFGASLIFGNASDLNEVAEFWHKAYDDLRQRVSARHRVELALGLAAERANVHLLPCPIEVQANFASPTLDCCLFHYGGESTSAFIMKQLISREARRVLRKGIRKKEIREVGLLLTNELIRFLR